MSEAAWVLDAVVPAVHGRQIAEHGGLAGVRDQGLLAAALARPKNLYHYSDPKPGLAELSAAYAFGIARNHPFIDGNKRAALVISQLFLRLNGMELKAPAVDEYQIFMDLAAGNLTEEALAHWISSHL